MAWCNGRIMLSALMVAVFSVFLVQAFDYTAAARLAPLVAAIPGLLLSCAQLFIEVRRALADGVAADDARAAQQRRAISLIGWFALMVGSSILFGVIVAALATVFAFLRHHQQESRGLSAALAGGFALLLYLVFNIALGTVLFEGFVYRWLFS